MESFEALTKMGFSNLGDTTKAEKSFGKIIALLNQLEIQSKSVTGIDPKKFLPQATIDRVKKLQKTWDGLERETSKKDELTKKIKAQNEAIEKQRETLKELEESRKALAVTNQAKGARKGALVSSQNADKKRRDEVAAEMTALEGEKGGKSSARYTVLKQELASLGQAIKNADREIDALSKDIADNQTKIKSYENNISNTSNAIQLLEKDLNDLKNSDITPKGLTELRQELAQITNQKIDQIPTDLQELQQVINSLTDEEIKEIAKSLNEIKQSASNLPDSAHKGAESIQDLVDSGKNAAQAANEIENLKNQVLQFFSITNAIQLFKRTIQSALDTVKELDAVMTETAVVTDFTVGDMWEKLPQYSKEASALGASIRDLYSATTLYYQQGLETEAAMGVGIETMKMARIANMDATDATTAMTAALRGFNMEVNELNAERVNDVYSELAAITAADTSQIATAMSKTASIAASANMEFETTSALLAQIIETTQEAPETAGTAMKTIIARFTEVKELFSEGMLTGEDEEGEEININKIDAALRTVGISLKDFLNGTKGIDDIFLELASKWNSLDLATQRYIATTAAGSRQQSRFIAMMSNYDRTMQLVTAANSSAGASQEQFDKTLESMEAKLQKLKNAWDQFAMGLANNEILKGAVDVLTGILETVNKLTESLSGGNGLAKSIISLMTVIGALKGGKSLFDSFVGNRAAQIGEVDLGEGKKGTITLGKGFQKQAESEGRDAGQAFIAGWQRALQQGKTGGLKEGIKGILGETEITETLDLDELEKRINSLPSLDTSFDLEFDNSKLFEAQNILNKIKTGELDFGDAAARLEELGVDITSIGQKAERVSGQMKTFKVDFQGVGIAATGVGTAISLLGGLFEKLGMEEAADKAKKLGSTMMSVGMIFTMLGPMINKLGISIGATGLYFGEAGKKALAAGLQAQLGWWPLIAIFVAIAGAVTILVGAFIAARNASPEYQLKQAAEAADEAAEAADKAAESYNNLKSSLDAIEEKENVLDDLIVGTNEWKDAVSELNNQILDLLAIYPELAQYISPEGGVLSISTEGQEIVLNKQRQNKADAEALNIGEQIDKVVAQEAVDYSSLDSRLIQYEWENVYETDQYGRQYVADVRQVENKELTEELAKGLASGTIAREDERLAFLDSYDGAYEDFLAFGRALLTSDQAIGVFTDSLLTAATANADVSEEFKSQIGGMYTEDMINKLITKYENENGLPDEADKRQYASMMGYTYEGGNKFKDSEGNVKTIGLQEIKEQLAPVKAQQEMTKVITGMESTFNSLKTSSSGLERAFANIISKADGMNLTFEDLQNLGNIKQSVITDAEGNMSFTGEMSELYKQFSDIFTEQELWDFILESRSNAMERNKQVAETLHSISLADNVGNSILFDNGINSEAMFGMAQNLYDVFLVSGEQATVGLGQRIDSILGELSPENAQIFADALNSIDWTNVDDIEGLSELLNDMGFEGEVADIEGFEDQIKEAAKALKQINFDTLKEEIKSTQELVKDIEGREDTERKFTEEEMNKMVKANPELANQFVMTGIDEFVYVGDSMESLIDALNDNTQAQLKEYADQVREAAGKSQKWEDLVQNGRTWTINNEAVGNDYDVLSNIVSAQSIEGYGEEHVRELAASVGVADEKTIQEYDTQQLIDAITNAFNAYGSQTARAENFAAAETVTENENQMLYQNQQRTDFALLQDAQGSGENQQYAANQIVSEAVQYTQVSDELAKYNALLDENGQKKAGISDETYDAAIKEVKFATEIAKAKKEMEKYGKEADESLDILEDLEEGTEDYEDALDELAKETNKYLDSEIDGEFLQQGENLKLLEEALEGNASAWEEFNKNVMQATQDSMIANNQMAENFINNADNIAKMTSALDALEFDVNGTADVSQLVNEFLNAGGTASEVAAYLEQLGLTNIDLVAELKGASSLESAINGAGGTVPVGSIKATNVRLAPGSFSGFRGGGGRSGGGGGGGGEPEKWENPYDEFYNSIERINEELRTREKLERRYQKLLDSSNTKASDLVKNAREQISSLEKERKMRQDLLAGRERQMVDIETEYSDLSQYAQYNQDKDVIEIDWGKINALDGSTDEKLTSRIEEYITKLEEQQDLIEEEEDALADIEDAVKDIRDQGKDEYFDLEGQIRDAIQASRQEEIDKLSSINDSINDTNSRLIDAMQSSIDKYRQDRDNERTEEELSDKQRRLAYLQQDTSGANALDILALQEEIEQGQEDYTDTLIDQKITQLQEQNDRAAEQREHQIEIMQAQLDHYLQTGEIWNEVYGLLGNGIGPDGVIPGSMLEALLRKNAEFEGMSNLEKMKWMEETENLVAEAVKWLTIGNSTKALKDNGELAKGQSVTFTTSDGKTLTGKVDAQGAVTSGGRTYEDVYRNYDGSYTTTEKSQPAATTVSKPTPTPAPAPAPAPQKTYPYGKASEISKNVSWGSTGQNVKAVQYALNELGYRAGEVDGIFGQNTYNAVLKFQKDAKTNGWNPDIGSPDGIVGPRTRKAFAFKEYKTGGLADFTGPAWLDGTKSKPEYILNAEQTKSFFELVDVLGGLRGNTNQSSQITGDSIYDVDINVESIGNDYDVEQLANTIKRMINDDARYRNNNAINLQR